MQFENRIMECNSSHDYYDDSEEIEEQISNYVESLE